MRITFSARGGELATLVVDFLDVALDADRAHDMRGIAHPAPEPFEALAAHALRQHGDAVTAENARDRDAAAAIIAGRGPDRAIARGIEAAGDETRHQRRVGRQHLVRADHGKARAEQHDDRRLDARDRLRQHDMIGNGDRCRGDPARCANARARDCRRAARRDRRTAGARRCGPGIGVAPGELREGRQHDPAARAPARSPSALRPHRRSRARPGVRREPPPSFPPPSSVACGQ